MRTIFLAFLICITVPVYAQCTRTGQFQGDIYDVSGTVTITYSANGTKRASFLNDFQSEEGPDLYVYLANASTVNTTTGEAPGAEELEFLENLTGASEFVIPDHVQVNDYDYVVIHCKAFNQPWGYATLGGSQGGGCTSLSVADHSLKSIRFFPNPAKNHITFTSNLQDHIAVTLYNYSGLSIFQKQINATSKTLDLNYLSPGVYILELALDNKKSYRKLIVN